MDIYLFSLLLGGIGLGAMAVSGLSHHAHSSHGHAGSASGHAHGHAGTPHGAPHHGGVHGHAAAHAHGHGDVHGDTHVSGGGASRLALTLVSPRVLFSVLLGLGASGLVLRNTAVASLGGLVLAISALLGGVAFERLVVTPIWNFAFRFASRPALTLEHCLTEEATAVTAFDAKGQGIVAVEVDGQVVQLLATLQAGDRSRGVRVRAGERVRIEDVDAERNRCTVSSV